MERKEAIRLGLKSYNTGKPCKYGLIADRELPSGACKCEAHRALKREQEHKRDLANPEKKAERERAWAKKSGLKREWQRRWREQNRGKSSEYIKTYTEKSKSKLKARGQAWRAIRDGKLIPKPCEVCGCVSVEAHHDDYAKPLNVRWLCHEHHKETHRKYKREAA